MAIQPGVGYTFTTSSQGENINVIQPWSPMGLIGDQSKPLQFEVRAYGGVGSNTAAIQIAQGAVNFDQSTMPEVWETPETSRRQVWMQKLAVASSGITATNGAIPVGQTPWMDNGGHYTLPGDGFYYVTICKLDVDGTLDAGGITNSALVKTNTPFISVFKDSDPLYGIIFQQTGPSQYVNRTNVQRMEGYDAESTGLDYDFGGCHTEWFNPVKYGYDCKIIATINVSTESIESGGETINVKVLDIEQHVVGSMNMNIPLHFLGSTLYNEEGRSEADDPYNANEEFGFFNIVNWEHKAQFNDDITPLTTTFYTDMLGPADWTARWYDFDSECTGDTCSHPFHVRKVVTGETITHKVCTGMVNNMIPDNMDTTIELTTGYVYISCGVSGENYPYSVHIYQGSTVPADTESASYIAIARIVDSVAEQLVSSSLWTERFKCGGDPAKYWWSNV